MSQICISQPPKFTVRNMMISDGRDFTNNTQTTQRGQGLCRYMTGSDSRILVKSNSTQKVRFFELLACTSAKTVKLNREI